MNLDPASTNTSLQPRPGGARILSLSLVGLDAHVVRITAGVEQGPTALEVIGLSPQSARETRIRVRSALRAIGIELEGGTVVVRLECSGPVSTGSVDAAVALAVLTAIGKLDVECLQHTAIVGELSLDGRIRRVRGVLPMLTGAVSLGITRAIVPRANAGEAACAKGMDTLVAEHLGELVQGVTRGLQLEHASTLRTVTALTSPEPDLSEIRGHEATRRALEIAAAGHHPLLLTAPPGSGAVALVRRLAGILPRPSPEEALEITSIRSAAGLLEPDRGLVTSRPFRAPHHTVSLAGLTGGGDPVRPGEVTLAHSGVLFLDELLEFRRPVLEALGHALTAGCVTIVRAGARTTFPARPLLVALAPPCPCSFYGSSDRTCACSPERLRAYRERLRPLCAWFDLHLELAPQGVAELLKCPPGEPSELVRERVVRAQAFRAARAARALPPAGPGGGAADRLGLSIPAYAHVLHVARTIADLGESEVVQAAHMDEARRLTSGARPAPATNATEGDSAG